MTFIVDILIALRFFSRLPVPETARERALGATGFAQAAQLVPVAGVVIGLAPALLLFVATTLGLSALVGALLAIAALILVTGALHEDALADCADGFGGGRSRDRKLEIMRDSRIGAYGACAIMLSLSLRAAALASIADRSASLAALSVIAAAALSRTASLMPLVLLPPARTDGLGAAAQPPPGAVAIAAALAMAIAGALLAASAGPVRIVAAVALAPLAGLGVCAFARRQIGGQTGDVAGAAQQLAEVAVYLALAAAP